MHSETVPALQIAWNLHQLEQRGVFRSPVDVPDVTPAQIDVFRSVIHPEVVIRASETDLKVLDLRQSAMLARLGTPSHRLWE